MRNKNNVDWNINDWRDEKPFYMLHVVATVPTRLLASNNFIIFSNHIFMFLIVIGHQSIHNRMRQGFVSQVPNVYYDILL